jgi:hypothetical protein
LPIRAPRSRLTAAAALIAVGTFTIAANLAVGLEPGTPTQIPDSAFRPVSLPPALAGAPGTLAAPASTLGIPVIFEPMLPASPPPERAQPSLKAAKPIVVAVVPKTTHSISGTASWYCRAGVSPCTVDHLDDGGIDAYAAAGPRLRAAIGSNWRGNIVYVDGLRVQLIDWCQCYEGESNEKLLDLYYDVFARTGSRVTVRW